MTMSSYTKILSFTILKTHVILKCPIFLKSDIFWKLANDILFLWKRWLDLSISISYLFLTKFWISKKYFFAHIDDVLSTHTEPIWAIWCTNHTLWQLRNNVIRLAHLQKNDCSEYRTSSQNHWKNFEFSSVVDANRQTRVICDAAVDNVRTRSISRASWVIQSHDDGVNQSQIFHSN